MEIRSTSSEGKQDTEQHIKDTAKKVFFAKGLLNAKMQEIADEAGVNRALLHYYFRNREKLFETVLKEAMEEAFHNMFAVIGSTMPFEEKIQSIVGHLLDRTTQYPYMDTFIASEMLKKNDCASFSHPDSLNEEVKSRFLGEIQQYIIQNNLPISRPEHFVVNMLSLALYPSVAKPVIQDIFRFDDVQYNRFIQERKDIIVKMLLKKL
jgi:TetR/AcrR family transcriptional regulator